MKNNLEKIENKYIEDIEFKLSYQEDTIEKINEILTSQQLQMNKLNQQIKSIQEVVKRLYKQQENSTTEISEQYELPPHY